MCTCALNAVRACSCTLGESPSRWDVIGGGLVTIGCVGVGLFGDKKEQSFTFAELMQAFGQPLFIKFSVGVVLWTLLLGVFAVSGSLHRHSFEGKHSYTSRRLSSPLRR